MAGNDPVLVAGAGPVGLVTALLLAGAGVPVRVFEKREALSRASRASTFHPPTLEILDELGLAGAAGERRQGREGNPVPGCRP